MVNLFLRLALFKIFFLAFSLHSMGHDEDTGQPVIKIEMDSTCKKTSPCKHDITVSLKDGSKKIRTLSSVEIANFYWSFLTDTQRAHLMTEPKVRTKYISNYWD